MINLTADIDTEKVKRNLEGLRQAAKRVISDMINDFDLLDSAVRQVNKTLGGVGGNFHIPALSAKIRQAQNEFNKLEGFIMTPELSESASKEVKAFIASLEQLDKVLMDLPARAKSFDTIAASIRDLVTQADIFIDKIGQIQQSAVPIPSKTSVKSTPVSSTAQSTAPMIEAASYRELLGELKAVSGTKLQLIGQIEALKAKNKEYKSTVDAVNKSEKDGMRISEERATRRRNAALAIEQNKVLIQSLQRELREQIKVEQAVATSINDMTASLKRMQSVYSQLDAEQRQSPFGQNLYKNIEELEQRINGVGTAMQAQTPKVGSYASGWNGLSFSIQQVAREIPSFSYGLQTGFSAISNNLPILFDEITRTRKAVEMLKKSGQSYVPVWKQIASSLVSWQTLLVAGITVLTLYGKEIVNWTASLFKGRKEIDSAKIAMEQFHATMTQGTIAAQDEITKLDLLYQAATDAAKPYEDRKKAVERLQEIYPAYFGNMDSEMIMTGQLKGKYDELKASIIEVAQAKAASNQITEVSGRRLSLTETPGYEEYKKYLDLVKKGERDIETWTNEYTGDIVKTDRNLQQLNITRKALIDNLKKSTNESLLKDLEKFDYDIPNIEKVYEDTIERLAKPAEKLYTSLSSEELNDAAKKAREEAKRAAQQASKDEEQRLKELATALKKLALDAQQAEIDAMVEGSEKKIAQIKLDYKKRLTAIKEEEEKIKDLQGGTLSAGQQAKFSDIRQSALSLYMWDTSNTIGKKLNEDREAWNEYYIEYGTFRERLQATKEKYDRLLANAGTEGERAQIEAERDEALALIEAQSSEWAQKLTELTVSELEKRIAQTQKLLDEAASKYQALSSSDTPEAKQYQQTINKLTAQLAVMQDKAGKAKKAISNNDWKEGASLLNDISSTAREAADALGEFDEALGSVATFIANMASAAGNLITTISGAQAAAEAAGRSMTAMEKATVILAAISAAFQVMQGLFSLFGGRESAVEKTRREFAKLNEEIVRLRRESELGKWKGTIFGADDYRKASEGVQVYIEAMGRYNDTLERIRKRSLASSWLDISGQEKPWETAAQSIANMQVQTRHSTWFRSAKYQSLGSLLPGIFNEDGSINLEALKEFQGSDLFTKINDDNQKLINDLIGDWELYEKALDDVKEYLSGIFGDLGNTITDVLVDAFANGIDAAKSFTDSISRMLEDLAKDMVQSVYMTPILEKAQAEILEVMGNANLTDEQKFAQYAEIMKMVVSDAVSAQQDAMKLLDILQDTAKENGFNIFQPGNNASAQTATSRGIQTMSQDTGNELSGRFTDMQGKMNILVSGVDMIRSINMETRNTSIDIRDIMIQLNGNVADIRTYTRVLPAMNDTLASMNKKLDNL